MELTKELSHPKGGRAEHPEDRRHFQLCPYSSLGFAKLSWLSPCLVWTVYNALLQQH